MISESLFENDCQGLKKMRGGRDFKEETERKVFESPSTLSVLTPCHISCVIVVLLLRE